MNLNNMILLDIDLRLFDGAAAAAAGGDGAAGEGGTQGVQDTLSKAGTKSKTGSGRRSKSGGYENVVFGKQGDASGTADTSSDAGSSKGEGNAKKSGVTTTSDALEAKRQAFRELIEGEYKEQYTEAFNAYFNSRFKDAQVTRETLNAQKPIMDMLMQRYKVADGDLSKLQKAMEEDTSYWEKAADEAGMPVEQFKQHQQWERDSQELKMLKQNQQNMNQLYQDAASVRALYPEFDFQTELKDQTFVNLLRNRFPMQKAYEIKREAAKVKELYPGFDFNTEAADRTFVGMLRSGVPMRQAYEVKHMDEITAAAARNAAQSAGQQMTARIKSKSARPAENGTSSQSAVVVKSDVSKLTRKDRAEIARRVARGEKISF